MQFRSSNALRRILLCAVALAALTLLAACVQTGSETPGTTRGTISGSLSYGPADATAGDTTLRSAAATTDRITGVADAPSFELTAAGRDADFVPGEIVVKYLSTGEATPMAPMAPLATLQAAGVSLARAKTLALPRTALYRAAAVDRAETLAAVDALNARPDVAYAHPNYLLQPFLAPNDEYYPSMWHYAFVDMEGAWDLATGRPETVVAVLDTGMLMDHPDRPENLLGGYDFVSGDGDPADPGPNYHGSHVIGTLAAAANNDYRGGPDADGIAGVAWFTSVLPVRVLGPQGGTVSDIADAVVWSVGGSVSGVPANGHPADVVNLSLGVGIPCSQTPLLQDAINQAFTRGATVVAAAGNGGPDFIGDDAAETSPASCTNTFTVGAWEVTDERAPYSNWGEPLDLMAPGGSPNASVDTNGDGTPDGVRGLGYDGASYDFPWMSGTSMATPHVSGVIALMLDAEPGLTRTQVRDILMDTASPYTSSQCSAGQGIPSAGTACGAGILDARAAVEAAAGASPPPAPVDGTLEFDPESIALGTELSSATVTLINTGSSSMSWELVGARPDEENPTVIEDDVLYGAQDGIIAGGGTENITVGIYRGRVETPGAYTAYYLFDTDGDTTTAEAELPVTFIIPDQTTEGVSGPTIVEALLTTTWERSGGQSSSGAIFSYSFSVTPGSNYVYAWSDEDGDGFISAGDWYGDAPSSVHVEPGEAETGVDFTLTYVTSVEEVAARLPEGVTIEAIEADR